MIFFDTETDQEDIKKSPRLREITGGNAMISNLVFPPVNEDFVKRHVSAGAILYRILTTKELRAIESGQLLHNLNKMISLGCKSWQSILLVETSHERLPMEEYIDKIDLWVDHGGSSIESCGNPALYYLRKRQKTFDASNGERKSYIYPVFKPRKEIELITDWRNTLATFPGIGYRGATVIRDLMMNAEYGDNLLDALLFITDEKKLQESDGMLKEVMQKARQYLSLPDGMNISVDLSGYNQKEITE